MKTKISDMLKVGLSALTVLAMINGHAVYGMKDSASDSDHERSELAAREMCLESSEKDEEGYENLQLMDRYKQRYEKNAKKLKSLKLKLREREESHRKEILDLESKLRLDREEANRYVDSLKIQLDSLQQGAKRRERYIKNLETKNENLAQRIGVYNRWMEVKESDDGKQELLKQTQTALGVEQDRAEKLELKLWDAEEMLRERDERLRDNEDTVKKMRAQLMAEIERREDLERKNEKLGSILETERRTHKETAERLENLHEEEKSTAVKKAVTLEKIKYSEMINKAEITIELLNSELRGLRDANDNLRWQLEEEVSQLRNPEEEQIELTLKGLESTLKSDQKTNIEHNTDKQTDMNDDNKKATITRIETCRADQEVHEPMTKTKEASAYKTNDWLTEVKGMQPKQLSDEQIQRKEKVQNQERFNVNFYSDSDEQCFSDFAQQMEKNQDFRNIPQKHGKAVKKRGYSEVDSDNNSEKTRNYEKHKAATTEKTSKQTKKDDEKLRELEQEINLRTYSLKAMKNSRNTLKNAGGNIAKLENELKQLIAQYNLLKNQTH